jgi:hypothetical protein
VCRVGKAKRAHLGAAVGTALRAFAHPTHYARFAAFTSFTSVNTMPGARSRR